jgi:hypothetical protein
MRGRPEPPPAHHRFRHARLVPLALIALVFTLFFAFGLHRELSFEALRESRAALGAWVDAHPVLAPCLYMAVYVVVVACSLPIGLLMSPVGGFLFGTWLGGACAIGSATVGNLGEIILPITGGNASSTPLAGHFEHNGSGIQFDDRGTHRLGRGAPEWSVFAVRQKSTTDESITVS